MRLGRFAFTPSAALGCLLKFLAAPKAVILANVRTQGPQGKAAPLRPWIPAFAGMTLGARCENRVTRSILNGHETLKE